MRLRSTSFMTSLVMLGLVTLTSPCVAQDNPPDNSRLTPGKILERQISGGQTQVFVVTLVQGQFLRTVATSHGVDIMVTLVGPDGQKLLTVDLLKYPSPEPLSFDVERTGDYKLEIRTDAPPVVQGQYELSTEVKPQPEPTDRQRLMAERLLIEANDLEREGSKESLQKSIDKRGEAVALWRNLGDKYWEAYALHYSGRASVALNKNQEALAFYNQALTIRTEIRDRLGQTATLNNTGVTYSSLGEKQNALKFYTQALAVSEEIGDRAGQARALANLGTIYDRLGDFRMALETFERALVLGRPLGRKSDQAFTLGQIAAVHLRIGDVPAALKTYLDAVAQYRLANDVKGEAGMLRLAGSVSVLQGEYDKAFEYLSQSLRLSRGISNRLGEAEALNELAYLYRSTNEFLKSKQHSEEALLICQALENRGCIADGFLGIGLAYSALGDRAKALTYYNQALPLFRAANDDRGEADTLRSIGEAYKGSGDLTKALEFINKSLELYRGMGRRIDVANSLFSTAMIYRALGARPKAIETYQQALAVFTATGIHPSEILALLAIGATQDELGETQPALVTYGKAQVVAQGIGDKNGEANALIAIAKVYGKMKQYGAALSFYQRSLDAFRATGNRYEEARTLGMIGLLFDSEDDHKKALDYLGQALVLHRAVGDRSGESTALSMIGLVYGELRDPTNAVKCYYQALAIERAQGNKSGEAKILFQLMLIWRINRSLGVAAIFGKQAINLFQELRRDINGLGRDFQETYLKSVESNYRFLAETLIAQGRLPEAQQVLGLLKEQEYFEFVRRDGNEASSQTGSAELTPTEAAIEKRYNEIADRVTAIGVEFGKLREKKARTPEEEEQLAKLESDLTIANQVFQKFLEDIDKAFSGSAADGEKAFQLRESQGLQDTLRELGSGVVALYTVVGEDKYRLILITPEVQKAYEYPIGAADLNLKVLAFREALQNPQADPSPLAQELYKILIGPDLARDLAQANAQTLMWSLDGVLRYLPVAALHDGNAYLVKRYRNVVFTPASQSRLKDPVNVHWKALGLGVSKAQPGFNPLPGVPEELRGIIRDESGSQSAVGPDARTRGAGVLAGRVMLDEAFTASAMQTALREHYSLVHIASHFRFHPGNETDSFLLLGDGSHLTLAQIKSLPNVFSGVDLLTLSACDTATGGMGANGKEVEGFGVLAQRQGAKAVLATLWPVGDESTQMLMREFYRLHEANPRWTKAEALRQAQLLLLQGHKTNGAAIATAQRSSERLSEGSSPSPHLPFKSDPSAKYSHPYYWAPFILIGNWK